MNKSFTMMEAEQLDNCPNCKISLRREDNGTKLLFGMDREKDCITIFKCPECKITFHRNQKEIEKVSE